MASVWKHPKSQFYSACWNEPGGKRVKRSTKLMDKDAALELAKRWEAESRGLRTRHDPAEASARKRISDALRLCRNHYRKTAPSCARLLIRSAQNQLHQALADCRQLDLCLKQKEMDPVYVENFTVFTTKEALAGIHCLLRNQYEAFRQGKTPTFQAMLKGNFEQAKGKRVLERITESFRDGFDESVALQLHAESIGEMASRGNAKFFMDLRELLRANRENPYRRGLMDWIIRAWLPLCLWECEPDGNEAYRRMNDAADLLSMPFSGNDPHMFFLKSFLPAWRNVRSKRLKI